MKQIALLLMGLLVSASFALPDLLVGIELNGTIYDQGGVIYYGFDTVTRNSGNSTAGNSTTRVTGVSGPLFVNVPVLAPGAAHRYNTPWMAVRCGWSVNATADLQGQVAESNELNNNVTFFAPACSIGRDLVVSWINAPAKMQRNRTYNVTVQTTNIGDVSITNYTETRVTLDNYTSYISILPPLWPGQTRSLPAAVRCDILGGRLILAESDWSHLVAESNEWNNFRTKNVTCIDIISRPAPTPLDSAIGGGAGVVKERSAGVLNALGLGINLEMFEKLFGKK